jgi:hypothetical protein
MQDCVEVMAWWMKECVYFESNKRYRNLIDPLSRYNVVHAIKFSPFEASTSIDQQSAVPPS